MLVYVASKRIGEHVHSLGKVLGDRNVLYKYLNPNLIMVGTVAATNSKPIVAIYFIDAITGKLLEEVCSCDCDMIHKIIISNHHHNIN